MLSPGVVEVESVASKGRVTERGSNMRGVMRAGRAAQAERSGEKERTAEQREILFWRVRWSTGATGIEPRTAFSAATQPGSGVISSGNDFVKLFVIVPLTGSEGVEGLVVAGAGGGWSSSSKNEWQRQPTAVCVHLQDTNEAARRIISTRKRS